MSSGTVVVVGAGMAGARTCSALRAEGHDGEIVLVGQEQHLPYDRPPLSKAALAAEANSTFDTTFDIDYSRLQVKLRLGETATAVDARTRALTTDRGRLTYDALVVATGAAPVRLPGDGEQNLLRTREDAAALRAGLVPGGRVVVVGAGWIGAEVATAAVARGCRVRVLEAAAAPLAGVLGEEVGRRMLPWWRDVDLRTGVRVAEVRDRAVLLTDGTEVSGDLVVVGVGVHPVVGWLAGSGLTIDRAVAVDAGRRSSDSAIYAVGDAAARWSDRYRTRIPAGHWDEAVTGPLAAARSIVGSGPITDDVPYFWSDQFGRKVQYVGHHAPGDRVVVREGGDPNRWAAAWLSPDGVLRAHLSVSAPRHMVHARRAVDEQRTYEPEYLRSLGAVL